MRGDAGSGLQFRGGDLSALPLDPYRPHAGPGFVFQRGGKIDDGTAGIASIFPVLACALFIRCKKSKVHVLKLLGAHSLDKTDLVAHGLELAEGLVVIEQANIGGREVALVQHLGDLLALERSGAHDRGAVKISASGDGMRRKRGLDGVVHEVCDASL